MSENLRDRYVSFENIDCYKNAADVLDAMNRLFEIYPKAKNQFWVKFWDNLPDNYYENRQKEGSKDILYIVCSNVFYIYELFDEYDNDEGIELLELAELECC